VQLFPGKEVTLDEVLAGKEKKAQVQDELRRLHNATVVGIAVNMPGSVKYCAETADLALAALAELRRCLREAGLGVREERVYHLPTGPLAVLAVEGGAETVKRLAVAVETGEWSARLLDIDVYGADGRQLSRADLGLPARECLVCANDAVLCIRARSHEPEEVLAAACGLITAFRAAQAGDWPPAVEAIGTAAVTAMLMEVACTPAPGLVDRHNTGAHNDMDFTTFMKSSAAIAPALYRCALAGWRHTGRPEDLLPVLRRIGADGEKAMFAATEAVNTQKGLLFLLGVLAAAAGRVARRGRQDSPVDAVVGEAAAICRGLVERELRALRESSPARQLTAGERLYLRHGTTGIRGEISAGLPAVTRTGLPHLREALNSGLDLNDALIHALVAIMSAAEDTTILNRHDRRTLAAVQDDAKDIIACGGMLTAAGREKIRRIDIRYSAAGISPGGSADLLAATYFLHILDAGARGS